VIRLSVKLFLVKTILQQKSSLWIFYYFKFICLYIRQNKKEVKINKIYKRKEYDTAYSKIFTYMNGNYKKWKWMSLKEFICQEEKYSNVREMKKDLGEDRFNKLLGEYAVKYADRVFRTAAIGGGAKKKRQITIDLSKKNRNEIFVHEGEDIDNFYILNGEQILFYKDRLAFVDGQLVPAEVITDVWTDISWTGIANEGGVVFKNGKKPELLIKRILELFTNENDIVLDSFLGSGTTAAVAHKMNRKWIGIEMGPHCYTHCLPRLKAVVDGEQGGISKAVNWQGGGGFRFFELAPSLLKKDKYGNWVIDECYNADMLAAAMAKHQGFTYAPDSEVFWKQGYSFEKDYIFTTTQFVTLEYLDLIHQEMAGDESLLICCKAFQDGADQRYENINVKKIPSGSFK
jgi:adenine-specific DNA-methyltransferase